MAILWCAVAVLPVCVCVCVRVFGAPEPYGRSTGWWHTSIACRGVCRVVCAVCGVCFVSKHDTYTLSYEL